MKYIFVYEALAKNGYEMIKLLSYEAVHGRQLAINLPIMNGLIAHWLKYLLRLRRGHAWVRITLGL